MSRSPNHAFLLLACWLTTFAAKGEIIDTHVHLWQLDRPEGIYWIKKDNKALYRDFLPADHEPIAKANDVKGVVIVQAGQHLPDNQWNLDVTAHNKDLYRGVVGNLSKVIGTDAFKPLFDKLCTDKRYVGYRLSGREGDDLSEELFRDLRHTAAKGRTVDFLVGGYSLKDVATIAAKVPELSIILDHFGNVVLSEEPLDPEWEKDLRAAAALPNVYCKVSALYGRFKTQPAPQTIDKYRPILDLAVDAFGEDRLVFGSDWPVTRTSGEYGSVVQLTLDYFHPKGAEFLEKLFHSNAVRFYGLKKAAAPAAKGAAADPLDRLKMPGVHINRKERCVDIDATVCLDEGTLELVACTKDSKEHESIVAINASAMHVHTALLLLGAKSGKPAGQRTIDNDGNERWIDSPPSGGPVAVSLVINNETDAAVERPIHEFIIPTDAANPETEKFPTHNFLFAGSRVTATADGGRRYLCDQSGNVISITTFGDELLCPPRVESHENSALLWQVDNRHLPEPGTHVILRLRPQL